MGYSAKLLIAVGLGVLAAGLNWLAMSASTQPILFISVTEDLQVGDRFDSENLKPVEMPARFGTLSDTAIPYIDRGVLLQQPATRNFREGDLVFWRDLQLKGPDFDLREGEDALLVSLSGVEPAPGLLQVGNYVTFRFQIEDVRAAGQDDSSYDSPAVNDDAQWVGPFRLVSVGSTLTQDAGGTNNESSRITVAVQRGAQGRPPREVQQLVSFTDRQQSGQARLLGLKLHRSVD